MSNAGIRYAEDNLGANATYLEALSIEDKVALEQEKLLQLRKLITDLTRELANKGVDMPNVADSKTRTTEVDETNERISECESTIALLRMQHASRVARITELGGYFIFLASLKTAQSSRSVPPGYPW